LTVKKRPGDLTPFLEPAPENPVDFLQGVLTAWNAGTFANTVTFAGDQTQTDLPIIGDPGALTVNDIVMVMRRYTRYFIMGTITTP
jgi:hypothetical protein